MFYFCFKKKLIAIEKVKRLRHDLMLINDAEFLPRSFESVHLKFLKQAFLRCLKLNRLIVSTLYEDVCFREQNHYDFAHNWRIKSRLKNVDFKTMAFSAFLENWQALNEVLQAMDHLLIDLLDKKQQKHAMDKLLKLCQNSDAILLRFC